MSQLPMTAITPVPGSVKRNEVMRRAEEYETPPPPRHATVLIWLGAVLLLSSLGSLLLLL